MKEKEYSSWSSWLFGKSKTVSRDKLEVSLREGSGDEKEGKDKESAKTKDKAKDKGTKTLRDHESTKSPPRRSSKKKHRGKKKKRTTTTTTTSTTGVSQATAPGESQTQSPGSPATPDTDHSHISKVPPDNTARYEGMSQLTSNTRAKLWGGVWDEVDEPETTQR